MTGDRRGRMHAGSGIRSGSGSGGADYWFKPKRLGIGASPASWQGWAASFVFLAGAALVAQLARKGDPLLWILLLPLTVGFIALAVAKTEGGWRWRWGSRDD
ncbi:MAG: hypothetical protein ABW182_05545 [Sphingomonas sp.]